MTALLVGIIAAASIAPLWLSLARKRSALARAAGPAAAGLIMIALATFFAEEPARQPNNRPAQRLGDGYVGSATCRSCHPGEHASWHSSYHRTMTQPANRQTLQASLGDDERLELDFHGQQIALEWRGEELWVELEERSTPGAPPRRVWRPVVQLTGSHHAQVLWYSTGNGRQLGAVPMVYRIAERRWLPINAVFLMPPDIKQAPPHGTWNSNCISCHTTHAMPGLDTDRTDTHVGEFGIACEACHGPGLEHTLANRSPLRRYALHTADGEQVDETVTEPGQLETPRDSEVCGQCHSVSIVRREHFDSWREEGSPYRPGQVLDDAQLVVTPEAAQAPELRRQLQRDPHFFDNTFWPDGQVRVTGREFNGLIASPCHSPDHGDRSLSCMSCHSLHQQTDDRREQSQWANKQLREGMDGDRACLQCHPELEDPAQQQAHTHHEPGTVTCYDCHMPKTSYGLLKAVRSHAITSPSIQTELATGRPNACNLCHLDETLAWTGEHLQRWYGTEPATLTEDQRQVAAGPLWMLTGDAAQRALAADSSGSAAAQRACGTDWLAPYLGQLLADPYYAVRFIAERSLGSLQVTPPEDYDFLTNETNAQAGARSVQQDWQAAGNWQPNPQLLLGREGLLTNPFQRLLARRNNRRIILAE
ncbi:MAG: ammonia-forming cytochrome c nitrite reductase subunit c552 [Planctomycetota bacterium]|nr:ammonia-forming cytochrome c nitrite reductase subunit c552 [Planctomycetota bacterium]